MNKLLFLLPLLAIASGTVHAEPLEAVDSGILVDGGGSVMIELDWNPDETVEKYEVGCVSCTPNISEFTSNDWFVLDDVTAFPNSSNVMLYLIAFDSTDEIIAAKQIIVDIDQ